MSPLRPFDDLPNDPAEAALELARRGLKVFPCDPITKAPLTAHGFKDASNIERIVAGRFRSHPGAAIGLPMGQTNGLIVVDIESVDGHGVDGEAEVEALDALGFRLAGRAVRVRTWSGGLHLYYRCPLSLRPSFKFMPQRNVAPGVEVRGDGSYVIAPPSRRPDGKGWRVVRD
jgi:hypothetical protein